MYPIQHDRRFHIRIGSIPYEIEAFNQHTTNFLWLIYTSTKEWYTQTKDFVTFNRMAWLCESSNTFISLLSKKFFHIWHKQVLQQLSHGQLPSSIHGTMVYYIRPNICVFFQRNKIILERYCENQSNLLPYSWKGLSD